MWDRCRHAPGIVARDEAVDFWPTLVGVGREFLHVGDHAFRLSASRTNISETRDKPGGVGSGGKKRERDECQPKIVEKKGKERTTYAEPLFDISRRRPVKTTPTTKRKGRTEKKTPSRQARTRPRSGRGHRQLVRWTVSRTPCARTAEQG